MSRPIQEDKNDAVLQLDPKHERRDERLSDSERLESADEMMELAAEKIRKLEEEREELKGRVDPGASLLPPYWVSWVARTRVILAEARGHDGDTFRMEEVPGLLKDIRLLMYPPFAAAFGAYVLHGEPAEVQKTLRSLYKKMQRRYSHVVLARETWEQKWSGRTLAEIARDQKVSVKTIENRVSSVRRIFMEEARFRGDDLSDFAAFKHALVVPPRSSFGLP
jgi:hypothetical protein